MRNFLVTNLYNMHNMGEVLQLKSLVKNLPEDVFTLEASYTYLDPKICSELGVNYMNEGVPSRVKYAARVAKTLLGKSNTAKAIREADAVIDLGGDTLSDNPSPLYTLVHCATLMPAIRLGCPYIICSQSVGPFKTPITKALAKQVLRRAMLVTIRDPISYSYVKNLIGDASHVHHVPDLAYAYRGPTKPKLPVIGLCPSQLVPYYLGWNYDKYIETLAKLVTALRHYRDVVLIPHVLGPISGLGKVANVDDRYTIKQIQKIVNVVSIGPEDITSCETVISLRWHPCVTSLAHGIPAINLGSGYKATSFPTMSGIASIDLRQLSLDTLVDRVIKAYKELGPVEYRPNALTQFSLINRYYREYSEKYLGSYNRCYVGASTSSDLRASAASGGVTSSLMSLAVASGPIIGVDTNGYKEAVNLAEVQALAGSVYHTYSSKLVETKPVALTSSPCHIKLMRAHYPEAMVIGLLCAHQIEAIGVEHMLHRLHLVPEGLHYRAKLDGTTGMRVNGHFIPQSQYWGKLFNYTYIPKQCLKCSDMFAELADISVGDAWGFPNAKSLGLNLVVTRTSRGQALVDKALKEKLIDLQEISPKQAIRTQMEFVRIKKQCPTLKGRLYLIMRSIGNRLPRRVVDVWINLVVRPVRIK